MAKKIPGRIAEGSMPDPEQMTTQALEELLWQDAHSSCREFSAEFIDRVLEVIESRERNRPQSSLPDVDAAWASFQENYLPDVAECSFDDELLPIETADGDEKSSKPRRFGRRIRPVVVAAVICAILCSTLIAQAAGVDVWGAFARWTGEIFHFSEQSTKFQPPVADGADVEYQSLEDALKAYHISTPAAPTWWPSGFELAALSTHIHRGGVVISALYTKEEQALSVSIRFYSEPDNIPTILFEKDRMDLEKYLQNGVTHYIMQNLGKVRASWVHAQVAGSISGEITLQEMKKMIDSIYEG